MEAEFRLIEESLKEMTLELNAQKALLNESNTTSTNNKTQIIITAPNSPPDEPNPLNILNNSILYKSQRNSDQFIPVVNSFLDSARITLRETQLQHREMEEKVSHI